MSGNDFHWKKLKADLSKNIEPDRIATLDEESSLIIEKIRISELQTKKRIQGLVLGYVQSGKTENMIAISAKGLDEGYKIIIVLSGILNSLRKQTQLRFDEGWTKNPKTLQRMGIDVRYFEGPRPPRPGLEIESMTYADAKDNGGDYSKENIIPSSVMYGEDNIGNAPNFIWIIKKNKAILSSLRASLEAVGATNLEKIKLPVLVIDDESDQATINTGKLKNKISAINRELREFLNNYFEYVSYIGYTATPYANVLIDFREDDSEAGLDLYPRDFILPLNKKSGYLGALEYHGDVSGKYAGLPSVFEFIDDEEIVAVKKGNISLSDKSDVLKDVPSLERSILDFFISMAYAEDRGIKSHFSLMIHPDMRTNVSEKIGTIVLRYLNCMKEEMVPSERIYTEIISLHKEHYKKSCSIQKELSKLSYEHEVIPKAIQRIEDERLISSIRASLQKIEVMQLHSRSKDFLDYDKTNSKKYIIIGGNKLSRGLTIQGLLGTFFAREPNGYDTVMQMGRWFGYRLGYADLIRIKCSADSHDDFTSLVEVEEDLRDQINQLVLSGASPLKFPPTIMKITGLNIVAKNRMGAAKLTEKSFGTVTSLDKFNLTSFENSKKNIDLILKAFSSFGAKFTQLRNQQLYFTQRNTSSTGFEILRIALEERFPEHWEGFKRFLSDMGDKIQWQFFLRGGEGWTNNEDGSKRQLSVMLGDQRIEFNSASRPITSTKQRFSHVKAPEDYREVTSQISLDTTRDAVLGFYLMNVKDSILKTRSSRSDSSFMDEFLSIPEDSAWTLVPTIWLPSGSSYYERYGQEPLIDEEDETEEDDV
ncbi:MAG: Z1 domain-containing protein [Bacteriovoracaceae bacterium]|nr:Z1 domain-containing protein [Bacteriovoracaceae bacterium]